ncbi:MAG: hypothetical protein JWP30_1271 [Homoserinimonas sp.]|nr:hypothetical protein [Homoserinimonas sp.]
MVIPFSIMVQRHETSTGVRLQIRNNQSGAEVQLDPIELEGLTRWDRGDGAAELVPAVSERGVIYQNEFAMVEVYQVDGANGPQVLIKDLSLGAEVFLDTSDLEILTQWHHDRFAPLVDPSAFTHSPEPDPDEV